MLTTSIPARANSAIQQLGSGLGAYLGGLSLRTDSAGHISGYGINGWAAAGLTLFMVVWVGRVQGVPAPAMASKAA